MKIEPTTRKDYGYFVPLTTRWSDNDVYGHVNNVVFYSYFDTAVNRYLIEHGLDIVRSKEIALVVESQCHYHAPVAYPDALLAGVRVEKLSQRAVTWGVGIFKAGDVAIAHGRFVHVFVDRATRAATSIPEALRTALARLNSPAASGRA